MMRKQNPRYGRPENFRRIWGWLKIETTLYHGLADVLKKVVRG